MQDILTLCILVHFNSSSGGSIAGYIIGAIVVIVVIVVVVIIIKKKQAMRTRQVNTVATVTTVHHQPPPPGNNPISKCWGVFPPKHLIFLLLFFCKWDIFSVMVSLFWEVDTGEVWLYSKLSNWLMFLKIAQIY